MSARQFKAIVFDFDLTLVDSRQGFIDAHAFATKRLGLPALDIENAARTIGTPLPIAFRQLHPGHEAVVDEYISLWQARADERMTGLTVVLPGAGETVQSLHAAGLSLGIVSQKWRYRVEDVLRREGLLECFAAVIGGDDAPEFKPDPRGILMCLDRLGATAQDSVYVGDTVIDAEAARRAGLPFIGLLSGFARRDDFEGYAAYAILDSVAELPRLFGLA